MSREYRCKFYPYYSADTLAEFGQHVRKFHPNQLLKKWEEINAEDRLVTDGRCTDGEEVGPRGDG